VRGRLVGDGVPRPPSSADTTCRRRNAKLRPDKRARIDPAEIVSTAREGMALERLDQITYAVLEQSGSISITRIRSSRGSVQR
jgi:hypothetical protein